MTVYHGPGRASDIVLPVTVTAGDARPSLSELYPGAPDSIEAFEAFEAAVRSAARELVDARTLLHEDVERAVDRALEAWRHAVAR